MDTIVIDNLSERMISLIPEKNITKEIYTTFDIYYDTFFTKKIFIPPKNDPRLVKLKSKGDWGFYVFAPGVYHVVYIPNGLTVYHTCSLKSVHQIIGYLLATVSKLMTDKKITKTLLSKLGAVLRRYRPIFDTNYFASGLKYIGEFLGFADREMNIGVAISYYDSKTGKHRFMSKKNIDYLREISIGDFIDQKYIPNIFVDSGAFSVGQALMKFTKGESNVEPEKLNFEKVLKKYIELIRWKPKYEGNSDPTRFFFVAPDVIADPESSIQELKNNIVLLKKIKKLGSHLIVPLHDTPDYPMSYFYTQVEDLLGKDGFIAGIPTVKGVTKLSRFIKFLKKVKPPQIHFLGMGYTGSYYRPFIEAVQCYSPKSQVFLDAVRLTALIGRAKKRKGESLIDDFIRIRGRDKVYTRMRDEAEAQLKDENFEDAIEMILSSSDSIDRSLHLMTLEKKLRVNLDDIDEWIGGGETGWLDEYVPGNEKLEQELYNTLDYLFNFLPYEADIFKEIISKEPSRAIDIAHDLIRYKDLIDQYDNIPLEVLADSGRHDDYLSDIESGLSQEEKDDIQMQFDHFEEEGVGIFNDWVWSWYKTFPYTVLKELKNAQKDKLKENEFYAEKTRRAIAKLSDKDLARIR